MNTTKHNITNTAEPIKQGYKKTSVGIIPEEWEMKSIGEVGEVITGSTPRTSEKEYYDGEKLFVSPADITDNVYVNQTEKTLTDLGLNQGRIVAKNSVLFVSIGSTIGKVAISGQRLITNQQINSIVPNKETQYYFLYNLLKYKAPRIKLLAANQAVPILNKSEFSKIQLPIPPLPEQNAIADCLSTWDKGIEKLSALIASKKEQKKGLMQQLLTGEKRLDGFTEEWETKRLNVIGKVNYGTRIVKGNVEEGEYFVYGGGGKTFTNKEYNREDRMIIARFAMSKECARFVKGKFYLNDSGLTVDANEKTNQSFLDYLLFFNQHNIYKLRAGGAQQNLDVQAFRGISLSIPAINEQIAIADILNTSDKEIELLEQKLESYKTQKKGLMQVLLTGEKRLV